MNSLLNEETLKQLKEMFSLVAEKLGQGGEFVYRVYRRQIYVEAVRDLLSMSFGLLLLWGVKRTWESLQKTWKTSSDGGEVVFGFFWILGLGLGLLCLFSGLYGFLSKLINPDYYVIQKLLEIVKESG